MTVVVESHPIPVMVMPSVVEAPSVAGIEMPKVDVPRSILGHRMDKNRLQEYAQRLGISLPSYTTFNEGLQHMPMFRGTVSIDGMSFTSSSTFSHRKEAEHDVAKLALDYLSVKHKNEASHYIHKDPVFSKLILNEYGVKLKIGRPTYNTTEQKGILPTFITTASFDGKSYLGFPGKNKKEAEQNAACVVIDSILANPNEGNAIAQIIKTKGRLYAAVGCGVNVQNVAMRSGIGSDSAYDVNNRLDVVATTNGGVPCSTSVDVAQGNQVNYQIPSSGLTVVIESPAINPKKRNKKSKKQKDEQSKRTRVAEEASTSTNPIKDEEED